MDMMTTDHHQDMLRRFSKFNSFQFFRLLFSISPFIRYLGHRPSGTTHTYRAKLSRSVKFLTGAAVHVLNSKDVSYSYITNLVIVL